MTLEHTIPILKEDRLLSSPERKLQVTTPYHMPSMVILIVPGSTEQNYIRQLSCDIP